MINAEIVNFGRTEALSGSILWILSIPYVHWKATRHARVLSLIALSQAELEVRVKQDVEKARRRRQEASEREEERVAEERRRREVVGQKWATVRADRSRVSRATKVGREADYSRLRSSWCGRADSWQAKDIMVTRTTYVRS